MGNSPKLTEIKDIRGSMKFRNFNTTTSNSINNAFSDPKSRFFPLNSYNWGEEYTDNLSTEEKYSVPKMIITEFQPIKKYKWEEKVKSLKVLFGNLSNIKEASKNSVQLIDKESLFTEYSKNPDKAYNKDSIAMQFVRKLFSGHKLNKYELPFFSDVYINADNTEGWSMSGSEKLLGEKISDIVKNNFSINVPTIPTWNKIDDTMAFEYEFFLINNLYGADSTEILIKNFMFLHSLVSGCFWIQLGYIQQSPNIYDIIVPGRFHLYFAAVGISVEYVGKTRENKDAVNKLSNGINLPDNMLFPDAYKLSIKVKSLVPNNFNVYIDYLVNKDN